MCGIPVSQLDVCPGWLGLWCLKGGVLHLLLRGYFSLGAHGRKVDTRGKRSHWHSAISVSAQFSGYCLNLRSEGNHWWIDCILLRWHCFRLITTLGQYTKHPKRRIWLQNFMWNYTQLASHLLHLFSLTWYTFDIACFFSKHFAMQKSLFYLQKIFHLQKSAT